MKKTACTTRRRQKAQRLSTLVEVSRLICLSLNVDQILANVTAISKKAIKADASSLTLIDGKRTNLYLKWRSEVPAKN